MLLASCWTDQIRMLTYVNNRHVVMWLAQAWKGSGWEHCMLSRQAHKDITYQQAH